MKRFIEYIVCILVGIIIGLNIYNQCDTNRDGKVTASDYVKVRNYIMNKESDKYGN